MDVLRDGIWQFVGVLLAVAAILVSLWGLLRQRNRKILVYNIEFTSVLSVHSELKDDLRIIYRDRPVESAFIATITIRNVGDIPITRVDFDEPVSIALDGPGDVVRVDTSGSTMSVLATICGGNSIRLNPVLFNKNDKVTMKIVGVNGPMLAVVSGRIVGGVLLSQSELNKTILYRIKNILSDGNTVHSLLMVVLVVATSMIVIIVDLLTPILNRMEKLLSGY
jgi:hypothetical protein